MGKTLTVQRRPTGVDPCHYYRRPWHCVSTEMWFAPYPLENEISPWAYVAAPVYAMRREHSENSDLDLLNAHRERELCLCCQSNSLTIMSITVSQVIDHENHSTQTTCWLIMRTVYKLLKFKIFTLKLRQKLKESKS